MPPTFPQANTKFLTAVIHWLSSFPSSSIRHNEPIDHLARPQMITSVLRLLMDESFSVDIDFETYKNLNDLLFVDVSDVEEYTAIFTSVKQYFKDKLWSRKRLFKYLEMLKFDDLSRGDYFALSVLCFVFAEIGLHSYKSGIAISTISMLEEEDQEELKQFMYDEQDLSGRNLVLMQRVNLMEVENAELKKKLHLSENECAKLKKNQGHGEDEHEMEKALKEAKGECSKLKDELNSLRTLNKELKHELDQLNTDLLAIGSLQNSPRKKTASPRKQLHSATSPVTNTGDFDLLKWELNVMSDWICSLSIGDKYQGRRLTTDL